MKQFILLICILSIAFPGLGQQNRIILGGGYTFANIVDSDVNGSGWRINGSYEFNFQEGKLAHGISVGYISMTAEKGQGITKSSYKISTLPICYIPKLLFGNEKFKGFLKGAFGWQFSGFERTGALGTLEDNDSGLAIGAGLGAEYRFSQKFFLNAEYEWMWLTNSFYKNGFQHTLSASLGYRF